VSRMLESHGELTKLGASMCELRASLIRQYQTKQCDIASVVGTELWRSYIKQVQEHASRNIEFGRLFQEQREATELNEKKCAAEQPAVDSATKVTAPTRRKSPRKILSLRITIPEGPSTSSSSPLSHFGDEDELMNIQSAVARHSFAKYPASPTPSPRLHCPPPLSRKTSRSSSVCVKALSPRCDVGCVCGNSMRYTKNPGKKYPPNAVLRCQQSPQCSARIVVGQDGFYCCRSRTNYHRTKDGRFVICKECALSTNGKKERMRRNRILMKKLIEVAPDEHYQHSHNVLKEGFMMKMGNTWGSSFKKRYFVLFESRQMYYYSRCRDGTSQIHRGVVDLRQASVIKREDNGLDIVTRTREWKFRCSSSTERDDWYRAVSVVMLVE